MSSTLYEPRELLVNVFLANGIGLKARLDESKSPNRS